MASTAARTITHRTTVAESIREIVGHHELLLNLVRLELKAKYKASALGFAWSLLNPAMYLVVRTAPVTIGLPELRQKGRSFYDATVAGRVVQALPPDLVAGSGRVGDALLIELRR